MRYTHAAGWQGCRRNAAPTAEAEAAHSFAVHCPRSLVEMSFDASLAASYGPARWIRSHMTIADALASHAATQVA